MRSILAIIIIIICVGILFLILKTSKKKNIIDYIYILFLAIIICLLITGLINDNLNFDYLLKSPIA